MTIEAMENAKKDGKIRAWEVSNFDTFDLENLFKCPEGNKCVTNQVKYNLVERGIEFDLIPYMQKNHLPLIAYSPVIKGRLNTLNKQSTDLLNNIAQGHHATIYQILLAWSIRDGQTIAIPKSSNEEHVIANVQSADIQLTDTELKEIDKLIKKPQVKTNLSLW